MFRKFKKIFWAFTKTERAMFVAASVVAFASSITLITAVAGEITETAPARGGEFTEGLLVQPTYINPVIAATETDKVLIRFVFQKVDDLAEKIESSGDGRVWKVRLKENLLWHDGQALTSDDVIFTVQKIQDPDSRSYLAPSWQGALSQRLSERELQFTLSVPYAFFEQSLKGLYVLPKHRFADVPVANWKISELNLKPVGSGPYEFDSYESEADGFITDFRFKANARMSASSPFISKFNFKFFRKREDLIKSFNSGWIDGLAGLEPQDLLGIQRPYEFLSFYLPNYYAVFLNQNQNIALKEIAVREALDAALDKNELVQKIFEGRAKPAYGPLPPTVAVLGEDLPNTTSSIDYANELLDNAGWKVGSGGIREKTIKTSTIILEFSLAVPEVPFLANTAKWLEEQWKKIGAKVAINEIPREEIRETAVKNRDYQMLLFGNILSPSGDLFSFWHSSERFYPGLNLSLYNNKKADQLIEDVRQNFDEEDRGEEFGELQRLIAGEYPAIFLYSPDYLYVLSTSKDLKGIIPGFIAEPADRFDRVEEWHLKTRRVLK